jgi:hypothetical protein
MNKSKLIIVSLFGAAVLGGLTVVEMGKKNTTSGTYVPVEFAENQNAKGKHWNDAKEYYDMIYANVNTGLVDPMDYELAKQQIMNTAWPKAANMSFTEEGPNNIGGRTRAITIDPTNSQIIYAGSVSGGLFKSLNGGNSWTRLQGWDDDVNTNSISSCVMTPNGTLYVAAGFNAYNDGFQSPNGLWYSTNGGQSFAKVNGSGTQSINKIAVDPTKPNTIYYVGSSLGVKRVTNGSDPGATIETLSNGITATATGSDIKVSPDGQHVLYTGFAGTLVVVSNDGGATFVNKTSQMNSAGINRVEGAISHNKTSAGKYTMYVVMSRGGNWGGAYMSEDNGDNWVQIAAPWTSTPSIPADQQFNPLNSGGISPQGVYDLVCEVVPGDPFTMIMGGIDLWRWRKTPNSNPIAGQFERLSYWFLPPFVPRYVHADNHRLVWSPEGRLYIGNDGGVGISFDTSLSIFTAANRGYNVTQFYAIAHGPGGQVLGGTQDNGTLYNNHQGVSYQEFSEFGGGDGFECELSNIKNGAGIGSIYYSSIFRSEDMSSSQSVNAPCGAGVPGQNCGTFATFMRLYEDLRDMDTQDSIMFIPDSNMFIGQTAVYYSKNFNMPLEYTLTQNLVVLYDSVKPLNDSVLPNFDTIPAGTWYYYNPQAQDTIMLPDYIQTLFVTGNNTGVYITRDIWKFAQLPTYNLIASNITSSSKFEFSKDGNTLWIGTYGGQLWRVTNLDSAYSPAQLSVTSPGFKLNVQQISVTGLGSQVVTDISVHPDDPNKVLITAGGAGGNNIFYSSNAMSATPSFASKNGNLPSYAVHAGELIKSPQGNITAVVGTEFGVFATESNLSGTVTWTPLNANDQIGKVPVYDIRQQWRPWSTTVANPGVIYVGTHGRGIWKSDDAASFQSLKPLVEEVINHPISNISIYPNPLRNEGTLKFELATQSDVMIQIFTLQGKLVRSVPLAKVPSGSHLINFNADEFAAGTYLVTFTVGNTREVTKFIKH